MTRRPSLLLALPLALACCHGVPGVNLDTAQLVDLTYPFDSTTIYWPTSKPFTRKVVHFATTKQGFFYAAGDYEAAEHGGTHLDAPIHFAAGKHTADRIPLSRLMGPAVVVDIRAGARCNPDYRLRRADLESWETRHGAIPPGAIVLAFSGWGRFWPDRKKYLGDDRPGKTDRLRFPGWSPEAVEMVVARRAAAIGIDTASIDPGSSTRFEAHQAAAAANLPAFENVAELDRLPARGAYVIALPMKIAGGSGGPARIVAVLP